MDIETLRDLCAKFWNPIGVPMANEANAGSLPFPALPENEYDGYLVSAVQLLNSGAELETVVKYLAMVEANYLGLTSPAGDKAAFVRELMAADE